MAASFVQISHAGNSVSPAAVTLSTGTTAGNIVVCVGAATSTSLSALLLKNDKGDTVTDSGFGFFTDAGSATTSFVKAFFAPTAGSQVYTFQFTGTAVCDLTVYEISGLTSAQFDKVVKAAGTAATFDSGSTGTLSSATEAAIAFCATTSVATASGSGWTNGQGSTVGTNTGDGQLPATSDWAEHRVIAATTAINGTGSTSGTWIAWCATFQAGAGTLPPGADFTTLVPSQVRAYSNDLRDWRQRRNFALVDTFLPQNNNYRWPLEQGYKRDYPNDLRTWAHRRNAALVDTFNPQENFYDWPLPKYPPRLEQTWLKEGNVLPPIRNPFSQTDWPNPKQFPRLDQTWVQRRNFALVDKFNPQDNFYDWPLPKQPSRIDQTWIYQSLQTTPNPIVQTDWPLPKTFSRLDQTWLQAGIFSPPQALSLPFDWQLTPSIYAGQTWLEPGNNLPPLPIVQTPFSQTDWPNPKQPLRIDETWIQRRNFALVDTFAPQNNRYDWPIPGRPSVLRTDVFQFIPPAPGNPVSQSDWPLPKTFSRLDQTWLQTGVFSPPINGLIPYDWQVTYPQGIGLTWFQATALYNTPPVVVTYDPSLRNQYNWPLPGSYPRLDQTWIESGNNLPPFQVSFNPLNQYDWPLPKAYPREDLLYWFQAKAIYTPVTIIPYDLTLRNQYSWPLPGRYPRLDQTWIETGNTSLPRSGSPISLPFRWDLTYPTFMGQTWLQQPTIALPLTISRTPTYSLSWKYPRLIQTDVKNSVLFATIPVRPQFPIAWPLPTPRYRIDPTWLQNNTRFVTFAKPVSQTDWPLPQRNIYSDKAWLQSESIGDLLTTPQPVFTYDQSLPRTYPRLIQPVTFPNLNIVVTASHLYSLPFDWPVPKGYPRMDQTWTQETALLYNQSPFAHPFDWPYIPGPPRIEQTVIESNAAILHLAGFSPFSQTDWPLYRARPAYPGIDQTWLQTRALILPPPLKPPLEYDWPNPKAYGRSPTLTDIQGNKTLYIPPPSAVVGLHYLPFFATTGQLKTF